MGVKVVIQLNAVIVEELGVCSHPPFEFILFRKPVSREHAHRLKQSEARLAMVIADDVHKTGVDEVEQQF